MKTKAAILFSINQPLRIIDLDIPKLKPGQVLVDIAYSGVCRSQLNEIKGLKGKDNYLPHTLGHEGSGIVLDVGQGVKKVNPGDHVVMTWIKGIGYDVPSTAYHSPEGLVNAGAISTFMQKTVISENRLVPISRDIPLKEAAVLGCAVPTGAGIVLNKIDASNCNSIAVFGVGGIGLSSIMIASTVGIKVIIAIDIIERKLNLAQKLGATHILNADGSDILSDIMGITNSKGVDYSIEAAGKKETMELAFQSVQDTKGKCIIAGNLSDGDMIEINPMYLIKGKKIVGTWGGETIPDEDIPKYVQWYLSGRIELDKLIKKEYHLHEINLAISDLENGKVDRPLINMNTKVLKE